MDLKDIKQRRERFKREWVSAAESRLSTTIDEYSDSQIAINLLGPTLSCVADISKPVLESHLEAKFDYVCLNPFVLFTEEMNIRDGGHRYSTSLEPLSGLPVQDFYMPNTQELLSLLSRDCRVRTLLEKLGRQQDTTPVLSQAGIGQVRLNNDSLEMVPAVTSGNVLQIESIESECEIFASSDVAYPSTKISEPGKDTEVTVESFEQEHIVVLPNRASGGMGVSVVDKTQEELKDTLQEAREISIDDKFVVREYIPHELSINAIGSVRPFGSPVTVSMTEQILYGNYYKGNIYPPLLEDHSRQKILRYNEQIGRTLAEIGYEGLYGCDYLVTADGDVFAIDLNPRFQGGLAPVLAHIRQVNKDLSRDVIRTEIGEGGEAFSEQPLLSDSNLAWAHFRLRPPQVPSNISGQVSGKNPLETIQWAIDSGTTSTRMQTYLPPGTKFIGGSHAGWVVSSGPIRANVLDELQTTVEAAEISLFDAEEANRDSL